MAHAQKPDATLVGAWHRLKQSSIILKIAIGLLIAFFVVPPIYAAYHRFSDANNERSDTKHIQTLAGTYLGESWTSTGAWYRQCRNVSHSLVETGELCVSQQDYILQTEDAQGLMTRFISEFQADEWEFGLPGEDVPTDKLTVLRIFLDGKADHWKMRFSRLSPVQSGAAGFDEVVFSDADSSREPQVRIKATVRYSIER